MNNTLIQAEELKEKFGFSDGEIKEMIDSGEIKTISFNGKLFYSGNFSNKQRICETDIVSKKWLTVSEAAIITGFSDSTIRRAVEKGAITSSVYKFTIYVNTNSLEDFAKKREIENAAKKQKSELKEKRRKENIAKYKAKKAYWARYGETISPDDFNTNF